MPVSAQQCNANIIFSHILHPSFLRLLSSHLIKWISSTIRLWFEYIPFIFYLLLVISLLYLPDIRALPIFLIKLIYFFPLQKQQYWDILWQPLCSWELLPIEYQYSYWSWEIFAGTWHHFQLILSLAILYLYDSKVHILLTLFFTEWITYLFKSFTALAFWSSTQVSSILLYII